MLLQDGREISQRSRNFATVAKFMWLQNFAGCEIYSSTPLQQKIDKNCKNKHIKN